MPAGGNAGAEDRLPAGGNAGAEGSLPAGGNAGPVKGPEVPVKQEPSSTLPAPKAKAKAQPTANLPPIPQKEAKKLAQQLKTWKGQGKTEMADQYANCKTQQEKRSFFYNVYMLDPEVSQKTVQKKASDSKRDVMTVKEGWWTKEQIAQDNGLHPMMKDFETLAEACVQGLNWRPHEDENLARLGIFQYEYTMIDKKSKRQREEKLQLNEAVDDVDADEFASMRLALAGGPAQKTITNANRSAASGSLPGGGIGGMNNPATLQKSTSFCIKGPGLP